MDHKMIFLILLYVTAIVSAGKPAPYSLREGPEHFENFIVAHDKVYSSEEEKAMRYEIFLRNLEEINQMNDKHEYAEFGVNQFTDLTTEEFRTRHTCYKAPSEYLGSCRLITSQTRNQDKVLKIPTQFDWRDMNVVTRVKNQGHSCGSCWAFSTIVLVAKDMHGVVDNDCSLTGLGPQSKNMKKDVRHIMVIYIFKTIDNIRYTEAIDNKKNPQWLQSLPNVESINAIKTGQLIELSEQQLVDCDNEDKGCGGGLPNRALEYLMSKGAMSSASYPYDAVDEECRYNERDVAVKVKDCIAVNGTEDFIAEQLVAIGPLSIGIDSTSLHSYKGGVLHGDSCRHYVPNHAVLLIGYGVDKGMPYWLMKNSYGVNIEENGYFRMQRGVNCLGFTTSQPPVSAVV